MRSDLVPVVFVVAGASLWGLIGLFTRGLYSEGVSPMQMTMMRGLVTAAVVGIAIAIADRQSFRIRPKDLWMFLGTGIVSIVFFTICYFTAQQMVSLSTASVLLYTAPCFVVVMSAFLFKERMTGYKMLALVLAFIGCVCTAGISGDINIGIVYGILSGLGYAMYSIFGKFALERYGQLTVVFYTFLISTLCLLPFGDLPGIIGLCGDTDVILNILGLGLISTVLPYCLYTVGLKRMDAGKASIIAFAEPMVATMLSILIGDEFGFTNILGILLILGSIILLSLKDVCSEQNVSG